MVSARVLLALAVQAAVAVGCQSGIVASADPSAAATVAEFTASPVAPTGAAGSSAVTPGYTSGPPSPPPTASSLPVHSAAPPTVAVSAPPTIAPSPSPASTPTSNPTPTSAPTPPIPVDATIDAAMARCPTAAEIAFVDQRLEMIFDYDPSPRRLVCKASEGSVDLTRFQEKMYQGVLAMRRIQFDRPLPWTDKSFFRWFTDNVNGIAFRDVEFNYCCDDGQIMVIVSSVSDPYDTVWMHVAPDCSGCGLFTLPGLFAHEARHAEGYPHTCGNLDQTFEEMGAWAVHQLYFHWLAEYANNAYMRPSDGPANLYADEARYIESGYDSRFCTPPEGP